MRTAAQETASQIALRNCSKEAGRKISIYVILVKGEYMQPSTHFLQKVAASLVQVTASQQEQTSVTMKDFSAFLDMRRYKNWAHKMGS